MRTLAFALLAVVAVAACSHDSTTAPSNTSSSGFTITTDSASLNQTANVDSTITVSVHVTKDSQPASGIVVTWSVNSGHGTVSATTTTTDAAGATSVRWTMGDTASLDNSLNASITGASVSIAATSVGGPVTALKMVTADSQKVVAGAGVPLAVRALDKFTNAVPNVSVNWSASAGALSAPTSVSGSTGDASTTFVTPSTPGTYKVTATIPGIGNVVYTVIAL